MSNVSQWNTAAANNSDAPPNGWPNGMAPSTVKDAARETAAIVSGVFAGSVRVKQTAGGKFCRGLIMRLIDDAVAAGARRSARRRRPSLCYHPGMDRIEIYRIANLLIEKHGNDAVLEAAKKADAMLEKGDLDGQQLWMAIGRVIKDTQRGERIN